MLSSLITTFHRLLESTEYEHCRYLYSDFNIGNRLTGLIGPRGTGKTTLLLQFIKNNFSGGKDCIYVSMDNILFSSNPLTEFVNELYEHHGIRNFFLDEVHKYPGWDRELKNLYDSYPDIKIIFSGSSSMDLIKGSYDLSRRAVLYRLNGMSFREYLRFNGIAEFDAVTLEDILNGGTALEKETALLKRLKGHFSDYLKYGYYPFYLEGKDSYGQKLLRVVEKTVYEDISSFYSLKTENLSNFRRIIAYLAGIPPGELNRNSISKHIGLDNRTVNNFLNMLHETGLVELISEKRSGSSALKSTEKIFLNNPNLYSFLAEETGADLNIGTVREVFFMRMLKNAGHKVFYSKTGDFEVGGITYEIGGKSKSGRQIRQASGKAYLVKDGILHGSKQEIPLHLFGFLY